jgi:hypothetical protein
VRLASTLELGVCAQGLFVIPPPLDTVQWDVTKSRGMPVALRGVAVLIAALALAAAALALAPAAAAVVPAPTILTPSDGSTVPYGSPVRVTGDNAVTGDLIEVFQGGNSACSFTATADGAWSCVSSVSAQLGRTSISAQQSDTTPSTTMGAESSFTVVPPPPGMAAAFSFTPGQQIVISGTGVATEGQVEVATGASGQPLCGPVVIDAEGDWSCTAPAGTLAIGDYSLSAVQRIGDAPSAATAGTLQIADATPAPLVPAGPAPKPTHHPVAPTPTSTPTSAPIPAPTPVAWVLEGAPTTVQPGDDVTLDGSGLPPGSSVDADFHSTPVRLGSTVVGADGRFSLPVVIPSTIAPGAHHFVVTMTPPGEVPSVVDQAVTVQPAAVAPIASPQPTPSRTVANGEAVGTRARDVPGAPNSLSTSIAPALAVITSPVAIGSSVIAGLVFLVLVAFPTELLSLAIKERVRRFERRPHGVRPSWWRALSEWFSRRPIFSGVLLVAVASIISGLADPQFGPDLATLRGVLASFIAALVVSYGTYALTNVVMNRRWALPTRLKLRPMTLIITVVGVVLSRMLDFSPGFLFGLMLGLSFPVGTTIALRARARMTRTWMILGVALVAWIAYSIVYAMTDGEASGFAGALLQDTLAALSAHGLTGMLIAMLPFLYLDGQDVWKHSRRLWAGTYAIVVLGFFFIVAPKPDSWADLGPRYGGWAVVLCAFAVVALGAYFWLRHGNRLAAVPPVAEKQSVSAE